MTNDIEIGSEWINNQTGEKVTVINAEAKIEFKKDDGKTELMPRILFLLSYTLVERVAENITKHNQQHNSIKSHAEKYPHYYRDVSHLKRIDLYRVFEMWGVHPALEHAIKKLIACGNRGAKDAQQDAKEAIDSIQRFIEMKAEDELK